LFHSKIPSSVSDYTFSTSKINEKKQSLSENNQNKTVSMPQEWLNVFFLSVDCKHRRIRGKTISFSDNSDQKLTFWKEPIKILKECWTVETLHINDDIWSQSRRHAWINSYWSISRRFYDYERRHWLNSLKNFIFLFFNVKKEELIHEVFHRTVLLDVVCSKETVLTILLMKCQHYDEVVPLKRV